VNNDMEHLNKGDYANGDPVEAVYYLRSKTFVYRARSKLVDEDAGEIFEGRHIIPIPKLKRKLKIQIKAGEWSGGEVNEEIELPKRIWSGRNTGVMFKVLFLDPGSEFAKYEKEMPGSAGGDGKADAHRLG